MPDLSEDSGKIRHLSFTNRAVRVNSSVVTRTKYIVRVTFYLHGSQTLVPEATIGYFLRRRSAAVRRDPWGEQWQRSLSRRPQRRVVVLSSSSLQVPSRARDGVMPRTAQNSNSVSSLWIS